MKRSKKKHWSKEAKRLFRNRLRARRRALRETNTVKVNAPKEAFGLGEAQTLKETCNGLQSKVTNLQLEHKRRDDLKDFLRPALELLNKIMEI